MAHLFHLTGKTNKNAYFQIELKGSPDYIELQISIDARIVGSCSISLPPGERIDDLEIIPKDRLRQLVTDLQQMTYDINTKYFNK